MVNHNDDGLPHELADRFTKPFYRFLKIEAATGIGLLAATCAALILANTTLSTSLTDFWHTPVGFRFGAFQFTRSVLHWINDGLMTIFFFVIALELKREVVLGELRRLRTAMLSAAGAVGGMLVPAGVYIAIMAGRPGLNGWGVVMATDTAFVIGGLALLGSRIPLSLRLFLLSLAIFDDVGAILVVAVGYGDSLSWSALVAAVLGIAAVAGAARIGIRSIPVYLLLGGAVWLAFDASGIHPTIAGVVLGIMAPTKSWVSDQRMTAIFQRVLSYPKGEHWSGDTQDRADLQTAGRAAQETLSPVERLEIKLHAWTGFVIMPLFAFANAGVEFADAQLLSPVSIAIFAGLVLGKPIGVVFFAWLAVRLGFADKPGDLSWSFLAAGALLTGIGFTMSLFIASLAYSPAMHAAAKIGILGGSAICGAAGLLALRWLSRTTRAT